MITQKTKESKVTRVFTQKTKESKVTRVLKAPFRVLIRAKNYYMNMSQCAGGMGYAGGTMGVPTPHVSALPKSFSVSSTRSSNDEDFRELMRIASTRSLGNKVEVEFLRRQQQSPAAGVVPRSQSVAIGRIEEDKACEFGDDVKVMSEFYPRSRSYAVAKRNVGMV